MAKYTIELRNVIEIYGKEEVTSWFTDYNLNDYLTNEEISVIETRGTWNKNKLAEAIIDYYYMREIGFETPWLFRHYVKSTMKGIMEIKAPLIYSASISYDPLVNVDYSETFERKTINDGSSNSNQDASGLTVNSDTPQGQINKTDILTGKYASQTQADESTSNNMISSNNTENENYTKKFKGNSGISATAQKMIQQYRDNIRGINYEIIEELSSCFMGIY